MTAYTTGSTRLVWNELQSLAASPNPSVYGLLRAHPESLGGNKGDSYEIGAIGDITVNSDASSTMSPDDLSTDTNALSLVVDREPGVCVLLSRRREEQMLGGNGAWVRELAKEADYAIYNYRERDVLDRMLTSAYDSSATYWVNPGGLTLTSAYLRAAIAYLRAQRGGTNNIGLVLSSYAESAVREMVGFTGVQAAIGSGPNEFGIRMIGMFDGVPVAISSELPGSLARGARTVATTAAVTSNTGVTHTYTVAAGHNIVPGNYVIVSGHDADENISSYTAVTSVTATTVVVTTSATNDGTSSDATGTITLRNSVGFAVDFGHCWKADTGRMLVDIRPEPRTTGRNLVVSPLYGTVYRAGRVVAIGCPRAALTQS